MVYISQRINCVKSINLFYYKKDYVNFTARSSTETGISTARTIKKSKNLYTIFKLMN